MNAPVASIIIVVYNAGKTLEASLQSVVSQTYAAIELVVIDGGSTDETPDIIKKYSSSIAYFISEKDKGIYDAMNKGVAAATGEWVYFLGSDDVFYATDVLEKMMDVAADGAADFIYGNVRMKSSGIVFGGSRTYYELMGRNISHQAIFYKRNLFDKVGAYDPAYRILADYDLNLRIFQKGGLVKKYVDEDICLFNDRGGASNTIIDYPFFSSKLKYFKEEEKIPAGDPVLQQYYFYTGFVQLWRDKKLKGLGLCLRSFTSGPRKIFYILVFIKFTFAYFGIGSKLKIV